MLGSGLLECGAVGDREDRRVLRALDLVLDINIVI